MKNYNNFVQKYTFEIPPASTIEEKSEDDENIKKIKIDIEDKKRKKLFLEGRYKTLINYINKKQIPEPRSTKIQTEIQDAKAALEDLDAEIGRLTKEVDPHAPELLKKEAIENAKTAGLETGRMTPDFENALNRFTDLQTKRRNNSVSIEDYVQERRKLNETFETQAELSKLNCPISKSVPNSPKGKDVDRFTDFTHPLQRPNTSAGKKPEIPLTPVAEENATPTSRTRSLTSRIPRPNFLRRKPSVRTRTDELSKKKI